jgi:hypothetical protein
LHNATSKAARLELEISTCNGHATDAQQQLAALQIAHARYEAEFVLLKGVLEEETKERDRQREIVAEKAIQRDKDRAEVEEMVSELGVKLRLDMDAMLEDVRETKNQTNDAFRNQTEGALEVLYARVEELSVGVAEVRLWEGEREERERKREREKETSERAEGWNVTLRRLGAQYELLNASVAALSKASVTEKQKEKEREKERETDKKSAESWNATLRRLEKSVNVSVDQLQSQLELLQTQWVSNRARQDDDIANVTALHAQVLYHHFLMCMLVCVCVCVCVSRTLTRISLSLSLQTATASSERMREVNVVITAALHAMRHLFAATGNFQRVL